MIESKSFGSKAFKVINAIILILLAFSCFYPLWYTFCVSISSKAAAEGGLVTVYPIGPNVKSYGLIMGDSAFWNSFWISIKRVVIGTVWTMVVLIMMSYPLAKSKTEYKPRNVLMWILVFCMLFNGGTIPWFITVKNYGMIDTMAALVLAGSVPVFNVLLMMNFFRGIPGDLEEAARVDQPGDPEVSGCDFMEPGISGDLNQRHLKSRERVCKNQTDDRAGKRNGRPGVCGRIPILLPGELSALHPGAFKTQEKGKQGRGRAACRADP